MRNLKNIIGVISTFLLISLWLVPALAQEGHRRYYQGPMRTWGPEQATGAPDTMEAGDRVTAWASLPLTLLAERAEQFQLPNSYAYEYYNPENLAVVQVEPEKVRSLFVLLRSTHSLPYFPVPKHSCFSPEHSLS